MKSNSKNNFKILNYTFPTINSLRNQKLSNSFFTFKTFIPSNYFIKNDNKNISKLQCDSMLDCGSYCNFISNNLVQKLNLKPIKIVNKLFVKGISGTTTKINSYVKLNFQLKIFTKGKFHFIYFKEKFLITDSIPIDLLFGNCFMKNYKIHYNYNNSYLYSN